VRWFIAGDLWDDGAAYERYVGRWSRPIARQFVRWLAVAPGSAWLDLGCGTGALTQGILDEASPRLVVGCDRSPAYTTSAAARIHDARARFVPADLSNLPETEGGFEAVVSGLVLNFLPSPMDGLATMAARARQGGAVGAYVFDYAEGMQMMRVFWDAAVVLDPAAGELDEGRRFPLCRPTSLREVFQRAGLSGIRVQALEVPTVFRDFDDYWEPFLGGQGPAPGYAMSLSPARRADLRELVRSRLTVSPDGTISLIARAWAAAGIVS
jgi:SAM-dependent methyltransferase